MKRLVLFGGIFIVMAIISSCKKEIIQPNASIETVEPDRGQYTQKALRETTTGTGDISTGEITDPNDDDYTRRPTKSKKN